jgi:hypothetical protein
MSPRQTTKDQRRAEDDAELDQQAWEDFLPKLAAAQTYRDALRLWDQAPRESAPGRRYYSNLGFFLQNFGVPEGSSSEERRHYVRLIKRMDADGWLKRGALEEILAKFAEARSPDVGVGIATAGDDPYP